MSGNKENMNKNIYISKSKKDKVRRFLDDFHFYKDGKTSFIMFCAYAFSFIGILSLYQKIQNTNYFDNAGIQSSYLIFSISFLAEIGLKLNTKKTIIVKMLYGIFFTLFFIVILICFASFTGMVIPDCYWRKIMVFFIVFLITLLLDSFLVYLIPPAIDYDNHSCTFNSSDLNNK